MAECGRKILSIILGVFYNIIVTGIDIHCHNIYIFKT